MRKLSIMCAMFIMVISMVTSCVPQKKIIYLQSEQLSNDSVMVSDEYLNKRHFDYKVQPGDNLQIRIASLDTKSAAFFNNMSSVTGMTSTSQYSSGNAAIYISGYIVNEEGYIDVPIVGELQVKNLTVEEIQDKIQEVVDEYLNETIVYVKLGLFNLTILGEVYKPGLYQVYQSDINIFQAIALAGNATDYANKSNVKIIHQTPNGSKITKVNLNEADILSSPEYYLKPNDIIYIEPLKMKQYGFTSVPYGTIISAISLLVTCFTFVAVYLK
ncbi:MAG: polysaccharide biosynthesis/export family protein [Bacteroidales bacterium]|nr:polysaccharide biosynthesis/export family protein [Bacteroidales bacterium]